jgi:uncharacterized membrane protein
MILRRVTLILFILFAILTAYPLAITTFHLTIPRSLTSMTTLTGFTFALLHAAQREGWQRALRLLALVFGVSLLFESVGVATGIVYGPYHYTNKLGPLFLGLVPYLIPVAWFMMSYPSYVIADRLIPAAGKRWQRLLAVAAVGGLAMTAWDLVMDPFMVAGGHWIWEVKGAYFGIPLQNFWGWWLTIFTTFALYGLFRGKPKEAASGRFDGWAIGAYAVMMFGIVSLWLAGGRGDMALIGLFAMAPWPMAAWLKTGQTSVENQPQASAVSMGPGKV